MIDSFGIRRIGRIGMFIKEIKQYRRHDFTGEMLQDLELNSYEFYECNFRGVNLSQLVTRGCIFDLSLIHI